MTSNNKITDENIGMKELLKVLGAWAEAPEDERGYLNLKAKDAVLEGFVQALKENEEDARLKSAAVSVPTIEI